MSIEPFYNEIRRFLKSSDAEVLIISGKWGVGKTFAWNKLLAEMRDARTIGMERYAYVSLFGLSGLEDVKAAVFQNTVNRDKAGFAADISTLDGALKTATSSWRQGFSFLRSAVTDYAAIMDKIGFFTVRNQIICIDDLERKSQSLDMRDVLGLISYLKEQRGCKVVILLNDEQLAGDEAEFRVQLEKVADTAVRFEPTPEQAAQIGIDTSISFSTGLTTAVSTLGIVNIRTIKKIEKAALRLEEMLSTFDHRVFDQALNSVALFAFSKHQPDDAPSLEFIRSLNPYEAMMVNEGEGLPHPEWRALLESYGFQQCDELDSVIMRGVERGHFDVDQLRAEAAKVQQQLRRQDEDNSFSEAWDLYHGSFDDNAEEVKDRIAAAIQATPNAITPLNLSGSIGLLKELGWTGDIAALIQGYIDNREAGRDFWDLDGDSFGGDVTDPDVRAAFAAKFLTFQETRDAGAILFEIGRDRGWNTSDVAFLASHDTNTFYELFKNARGGDLRRMIRGGLMFQNVVNADPDMQAVTRYAVEALERIGQESAINRRRVQQRGVAVPEPAPDQPNNPVQGD